MTDATITQCALCTAHLMRIKAKLQRLNVLADDTFGIYPAYATREQVAALSNLNKNLGRLLETIESTESA